MNQIEERNSLFTKITLTDVRNIKHLCIHYSIRYHYTLNALVWTLLNCRMLRINITSGVKNCIW